METEVRLIYLGLPCENGPDDIPPGFLHGINIHQYAGIMQVHETAHLRIDDFSQPVAEHKFKLLKLDCQLPLLRRSRK